MKRWQLADGEGPDSHRKVLEMGLCRSEKEGAVTVVEKLRLRLA